MKVACNEYVTTPPTMDKVRRMATGVKPTDYREPAVTASCLAASRRYSSSQRDWLVELLPILAVHKIRHAWIRVVAWAGVQLYAKLYANDHCGCADQVQAIKDVHEQCKTCRCCGQQYVCKLISMTVVVHRMSECEMQSRIFRAYKEPETVIHKMDCKLRQGPVRTDAMTIVIQAEIGRGS